MHHFLIVLRQFLLLKRGQPLGLSLRVIIQTLFSFLANLSNDPVKDQFDTDIGRWSAEAVRLQDGSHVSCDTLRLLLGGKEIVTYPVTPHKM